MKLAHCLGATLLLATSAHVYAKETITVYTAFETDLLSDFKNTFQKSHPDIDINWVRDSTGVITAKLLAEGKNTQADVIWGLAGSSLALLKEQGVIKPFTPVGVQSLKPTMIDPQANQAWYGHDAFFNVVCFNEIIAKQLNLPKPTTWEDLTKPIYKGHIVMPNPSSSGTGYTQVSAWLQTMGNEQGWDYMTRLDNNIAKYTHSGSKPCVESAQGETVIGISFALRAAKLKSQGAPIDLILPKGIGWDTEAVALVNTDSKAAQALVNWSITKEANELYNTVYPVVAHKEVSGEVKNYPDVESAIADIDFNAMANDRAAVLKKWSAHFESRTENRS
ncbi:putative 2-aminoethylphosphonate ABC transporter substrate-binding protein [Photobacterium sanguinicancri]|uniref:2-aminoethylphosphonate ABC transporter substrate-binding protein n=1 Tax=Photobacterium sanguinicancri TaxID=875932 RepID=A0ABX4FTN5_9GAMM|nr:putative 2-aminoethylphosphonate ABC transporter substrate-binding protein [Photobacterium sanguinicancri]MDO6496554.1 putative 2-aminoethylphosphonate ABC transporter substrate-binding protein [Photobacterium sanguinicancri]OZS42207.1 putative 2-aminoethylphosphonate ABC transporter substrate-binding protein [Photobacterium sanguinicancri]